MTRVILPMLALLSATCPPPPAAHAVDSPDGAYLAKYLGGPVAWRRWGEAALTEAARSGRPILLNIGYAACYWCGVMRRESYENPIAAAAINAAVVPVVVDREQQPDVDAYYQAAARELGQPTGWPLTLLLTPDGRPFAGGGYFPPEPRRGMASFSQMLAAAVGAWRDDPDGAGRSAVAARAGRADAERQAAVLDPAALAESLMAGIDPFHGGFGVPRHPRLAALELLWRRSLRGGDDEMRAAALLWLDSMVRGGLYDHLGGGFFRYATMPDWSEPHFEKMLDVNARFVATMTDLWRETRSPLLAARIRETVEFLLRELRLPGGAFGTGLAAETAGGEGAYYRWSDAELEAVLGRAAAERFRSLYGDGLPVLRGAWAEAAPLEPMRRTLLEARLGRDPPLRDGKAVADWNALAVAALAEAGAALAEPSWLEAATTAYRDIRASLFQNGVLRRYAIGGVAAGRATLDDHAHLAGAALTLHEVTGKAGYLADARALLEAAEAYRAPGGAYHLAPAPPAPGLARRVIALDHTAPSGNAAIGEAMARLALLTGERHWAARADALLTALAATAAADPVRHAGLGLAADTLAGAVQVVIIGRRDEPVVAEMLTRLWRTALPGRAAQTAAPNTDLPETHPAHGKPQLDGPTAYVCVGPICALPVTDADALEATLRAIRGPKRP